MTCLKDLTFRKRPSVGKTFLQKFWYFGSFFFSYFIFNTFTVFGIILIDAAIPSHILIQNGAIQVANVGEITPYYFVIGQLLLTAGVAMIFLIIRRGYARGNDDIFALLMVTSFFVGIVMMLFFMLFAWLYQWYLASGPYPIMHIVRDAGNRFLFTFAPIIIVDALNVALSSLILFHRGPRSVIAFTFLKDFFALLFSYLLCRLTILNVYGFIVGFLVANLPFLIGNFIYFQWKVYPGRWKIYGRDWRLLLQELFLYSFKDMWPQILKALVIIIIAFTLFRHISPTLSGFYYSRINWYMFLYLLPFLLTPTHLTFQVIKNIYPTTYNFNVNKRAKWEFEIIYNMMFAITILCMAGFYFAMEPLSAFYVQNLPPSWAAQNADEGISGPGIAYFLVLPNSLSYIFVAIYVFLMNYGFYFGDKMQFIIPKGAGKTTIKGLIGSLIGSLVTVAFIVGIGIALMNRDWVFSYMSSYSFTMVIVAFIVWLLSFTFYFITKAKIKKAMAGRTPGGKGTPPKHPRSPRKRGGFIRKEAHKAQV